MVYNGTKKVLKSTPKFICEICDYKCCNNSNYKKHLLTKKHKNAEMVHNGIKKVLKSTTTENQEWKCSCGKIYKFRSGYYRHKKICCKEDENNKELKNMFLSVVEENKELRKLITKQQEQIGDIIPRIGNTTTNLNVQMFLQESCKDALNISEFINSLNIHINDLEHTKKYGLCQGIANIFVNGLKELGTYKRPIHCTDIKRETLYIKDNNEWGKEESSKDILKKSLHELAVKQRKAISEWEESNPGWEKSEQLSQEWIILVKNVMGKIDEDAFIENKIIKSIAKEVKI